MLRRLRCVLGGRPSMDLGVNFAVAAVFVMLNEVLIIL
jgi:hypothetical protein